MCMIHFPTQYKRNKISGLFPLVLSFFLQFNVILFIFMLYVGTQTSAEKKRKGKKSQPTSFLIKQIKRRFLRRFLTKRGIKDMCFGRHTQIAAKNFLPHKNFYPSGSLVDESFLLCRTESRGENFIVA
jgi:hypothetical protein